MPHKQLSNIIHHAIITYHHQILLHAMAKYSFNLLLQTEFELSLIKPYIILM